MNGMEKSPYELWDTMQDARQRTAQLAVILERHECRSILNGVDPTDDVAVRDALKTLVRGEITVAHFGLLRDLIDGPDGKWIPKFVAELAEDREYAGRARAEELCRPEKEVEKRRKSARETIRRHLGS